MANTMKFFDRMLTVFLARQNPDSTRANPRFMKNTSDAVKSTQIVSRAIVSSSGVLAAASAFVPRHTATTAAREKVRRFNRLTLPPFNE
jgi:hypothetical protein